MSAPTSPAPSSPTSPRKADTSRVAEAALKRLTQPLSFDSKELQYEHERPLRQKFRRLVNPGIVRDNSEADTKKACEVLLKLCENLLSNPENPKFREFKSTNPTIQRALINPKGAIEYAIEIGFRATIEDFQPKYVWHSSPQNLVALRVGRDALREHMELAAVKEERSTVGKQTVMEEKEAAVRNALLAFEDDRKRRKDLDARYKETGYADVLPKKAPTTDITPKSPTFTTQGEGLTLGGPSARHGFVHEGDDAVVGDD